MSAQQIYHLDSNTTTDLLDDYLIKAGRMYMDNIKYGLSSCVDVKQLSLVTRLGDIVCDYESLGNRSDSDIQAAMQYINQQALGLENDC